MNGAPLKMSPTKIPKKTDRPFVNCLFSLYEEIWAINVLGQSTGKRENFENLMSAKRRISWVLIIILEDGDVLAKWISPRIHTNPRILKPAKNLWWIILSAVVIPIVVCVKLNVKSTGIRCGPDGDQT